MKICTEGYSTYIHQQNPGSGPSSPRATKNLWILLEVAWPIFRPVPKPAAMTCNVISKTHTCGRNKRRWGKKEKGDCKELTSRSETTESPRVVHASISWRTVLYSAIMLLATPAVTLWNSWSILEKVSSTSWPARTWPTSAQKDVSKFIRAFLSRRINKKQAADSNRE